MHHSGKDARIRKKNRAISFSSYQCQSSVRSYSGELSFNITVLSDTANFKIYSSIWKEIDCSNIVTWDFGKNRVSQMEK